MTCRDCTEAAAGDWPGFAAGCPGSAARAVAMGRNFRESMATGRKTSMYLAELAMVRVTHDQVQAAAAIDALGKERAAPC